MELDPRINAFLFGSIEDDTWESFTGYLTKRYGRTKEQRTKTLIDGIEREGRRPSEMAALLCDLTKDVAVEDIQKEQIFQRLPIDVLRALSKELDTLSLEEFAEAADAYFDQQGRPRFTTPTSTINKIDNSTRKTERRSQITHLSTAQTSMEPASSTFTSAFPADGDAVNAVHRRPSNSQTRPGPGALRQPQVASTRPKDRRRVVTFDSDGNCYFHATYGVKADKCHPGCKHPNAGNAGNMGNAGNANGGQRK